MSSRLASEHATLHGTDEYLAYLESVRQLSPASVRAYRGDLTAFASWLEKSDLTEDEIEEIIPEKSTRISQRRLQEYIHNLG